MSKQLEEEETSIVQIDRCEEDKSKVTANYFLNLFYNGEAGKTDQKEINKIAEQHHNRMPFNNNPFMAPIIKSEESGTGWWQLAIGILLCAIIIFVYFDMKTEYARQLATSKMKIAQCLREFEENECSNPVEILEETCNKLRECYHMEPSAKLTMVFAKVLTNMVRTVF